MVSKAVHFASMTFAPSFHSLNGRRSWRVSAGLRGAFSYLRGGRLRAPCATSCFIREPFALDALKDDGSALGVVNPKRLAVRVPMAKLGQVPLQVGFAHAMIDAGNAAFQDREKSLDRIGVNVAPHVFARLVLDMVALEPASGILRGVILVGIDRGAARDVLRHDPREIGTVDLRDMEGANASAALNQRKDRRLTARRAFALFGYALVPVLVLFFSADIGFVNLYRMAFAADRRRAVAIHGFPDTVPEEPRGFHAALEHPLNLAGGDSLLASAHQVDHLQPQVQRQMGRLENGPMTHGKGLATLVALAKAGAGGLARQLADLGRVSVAAMGARRAVRPQVRLDVRKRSGFVLEMGGGKNGMGHGLSPWPPFYLLGLVCQV